jgi:hypothetical protein
MRLGILRKCCIAVMAGGCLYASACLPTKDQIGSTINSGIMSGIELAITLAIESAISQQSISSLLSGTSSTSST